MHAFRKTRHTRAIVSCLLGALPCALAAQTVVRHGQPLDPAADVRIMSLGGSITVEGWDLDSVDVSGTVAKNLTPFIGGSRGGFKISTYEGRVSGDASSQLLVRVPRRARVWVKTTQAAISVTGVVGSVDAYTLGGRIVVRGTPESLVAESLRGAIRLSGRPSWVRARNGSGEVHADDLRARDILITTVSGPINGRLQADRVRLETMSGPIATTHAWLPRSVTDIDTHDGAITLWQVNAPRESARAAAAPAPALSVRVFSQRGRITNAWTGDRPVGTPAEGMSLNFGSGDSRLVVRTFSGLVTLQPTK